LDLVASEIVKLSQVETRHRDHVEAGRSGRARCRRAARRRGRPALARSV